MMMNEKAVSEIVGTLILISIVFLGLGIIAVFMYSNPLPETRPKAVLSSSCIDCGNGNFTIIVRHDGGEVVNPAGMEYFVTTEYPEGIVSDVGVRVNGTKAYPAEDFSGYSRSDICKEAFNETSGKFDYKDAKSLKNGDVIVIAYSMKE